MSKKLNIILVSGLVFTLTILFSCASNTSAINDLEQFTTTLEEQSGKYTPDDWEKATERYNDIKSKIDQDKLTDEERAQVAALKKRCAAVIARNAVNEILGEFGDLGTILKSIASDKGMEDAADQLLGGLNEGLQGLTEQLKKIKKEDIQKAKEGVNDVLKELERLATDLSESLKDSVLFEEPTTAE